MRVATTFAALLGVALLSASVDASRATLDSKVVSSVKTAANAANGRAAWADDRTTRDASFGQSRGTDEWNTKDLLAQSNRVAHGVLKADSSGEAVQQQQDRETETLQKLSNLDPYSSEDLMNIGGNDENQYTDDTTSDEPELDGSSLDKEGLPELSYDNRPPREDMDEQPKSYDQECPVPQEADDVKQAYIAHGTFDWRELAEKAQAARTGLDAAIRSQGQDSSKDSAGNIADAQHKASSLSPASSSSPAEVKRPQLQQQPQTQKQQPGVRQPSAKAPKNAAQQPKRQLLQGTTQETKLPTPTTAPTAAPRDAAGASVSVAALPDSGSDASFLRPTSLEETDYGFNGVRPMYIPSDAALAVGPHPMDAEGVMVIYGAQGSFDVSYVMQKDGKPVEQVTKTRVYMDDMMAVTGLNLTNIYGVNPTAWYDAKEKRYVLMWATAYISTSEPEPKIAYPLFVAVSATSNPLGRYTVWALDTMPNIAPGLGFCRGRSLFEYAAEKPKGSYSDDGIFVSMGAYCSDKEDYDFLSVLYAFSKDKLYSTPAEDEPCEVYAATYLAPTAWHRSIPAKGKALIDEDHKPVNSHILPVRPQDVEDISQAPMFIMQVSDSMISVATLTGESLRLMDCKDAAPKIMATLIGKGAHFQNKETDVSLLPQPDTSRTLDATVGTSGRNFELQVDWAMHAEGNLYFTIAEFWGDDNGRMPSIYWAVVQPSKGLCSASRLEWGVVASSERLALALPVIAAGQDCTAKLAFAYSGAGSISDGQYPAYPGVASAAVGGGQYEKIIQIEKRGPGVINRPELSDPQAWGTYSAAQVHAGKMWYAVVIPAKAKGTDQIKHGSWIGAVEL